jgi:hypothetical protein
MFFLSGLLLPAAYCLLHASLQLYFSKGDQNCFLEAKESRLSSTENAELAGRKAKSHGQ